MPGKYQVINMVGLNLKRLLLGEDRVQGFEYLKSQWGIPGLLHGLYVLHVYILITSDPSSRGTC